MTVPPRRSMLQPMSSLGPIHSQALLLLVLLAVTNTGMPSHNHWDDAEGPELASADHHSHGVLLVEQPERLTTSIGVAFIPAPAAEVARGEAGPAEPVPENGPILPPHDQAPPPAQPRAPPSA